MNWNGCCAEQSPIPHPQMAPPWLRHRFRVGQLRLTLLYDVRPLHRLQFSNSRLLGPKRLWLYTATGIFLIDCHSSRPFRLSDRLLQFVKHTDTTVPCMCFHTNFRGPIFPAFYVRYHFFPVVLAMAYPLLRLCLDGSARHPPGDGCLLKSDFKTLLNSER